MQDAYKETWFEWIGSSDLPSQPFVILTAYNPGGKSPGENPGEALRLNESANRLLKAEMERLSPHRRVHNVAGESKDRLHQEPSWAGCIPLDDALTLGRKYGQDAIFYISENVLYLVSCEPEAEIEPIAQWESRQV